MALETAAVPNRSIYQSLAYSSPMSHYVGGLDLSTPISKLQEVRDKADLMTGFVKPVNALNPDIARRDARTNYYKTALDDISNYENPYDQIRATRKLAQEYVDEMHQGELGTIANRYAQREDYRKRLLEGVEKKRYSQSKADNLLRIADYEYDKQKGIGEKNSLGAYNPYTSKEAVSDVNIIDEMDKITKGIMADKYSTTKGWQEVADSTGRRFLKNTQSGETVKFEDAYNLAMKAAESHPDIMPYLQQNQYIKNYGKNITAEDLAPFASQVKDSKGRVIGDAAESLLGKGNTVDKVVSDLIGQGYTQQEAYNKVYDTLSNKNELSRYASQIANKYAYQEIANDQDMTHEKEQEWEAMKRAGVGQWEEQNPTSSMTDIINNPHTVPEIQKLEDNSSLDGYLDSKGLWSNPLWNGPGPAPDGYRKLNGKTISNKEYFELRDKYEREYNLLKSNVKEYVNSPEVKSKYGDLPAQIQASIPQGNMTDSQYRATVLDKVNEVIRANKTQKVTIDVLPTSQSDKETNLYFGDVRENNGKTSGGIGIITNKGIWYKGELTNFEELAKKLGVTSAQLASTGRVTGRARPDNPLAPAAMSASVMDKDGNYVKIYIDKESEQAANIRNPVHQLTAPLFDLKLDESRTVDIAGRKVKAKPVDIWTDGSGNEVIQYKEGDNFVTRQAGSKRPVDLDDNTKYSHRVVIVDEDNDPSTEPVVYRLDENGRATIADVNNYINAIDVYRNQSGTDKVSSVGKKDVENPKIKREQQIVE